MKSSSKDILKLINRLEQDWQTYFAGKDILLGLSGGLDSSCLFQLFCESSLKPRLHALHFNYQLRGEESDGDADFCASLCAEHQVPLKTVTPGGPAPSSGVQDWARQLRRAEFLRWQQRGFVVALAHHADDAAENVIFRLSRGASLGHLIGMAPIDGLFWRPLLTHSRAIIAEWAKQKRWDHRNDSSNAKIGYSRNFIRHEILRRLEQRFPGASRRIVALATEAEEIERYCLATLSEKIGPKPREMTAVALCSMSEGVAFQALRLMLRAIGEDTISAQISRDLWHQIYERVKSSQDQEINWCFDLPAGLVFKFDRGIVTVLNARQSQKQNRSAQHAGGLLQETQEALLEPGANLSIYFDEAPESKITLRNSFAFMKLLEASKQNTAI